MNHQRLHRANSCIKALTKEQEPVRYCQLACRSNWHPTHCYHILICSFATSPYARVCAIRPELMAEGDFREQSMIIHGALQSKKHPNLSTVGLIVHELALKNQTNHEINSLL